MTRRRTLMSVLLAAAVLSLLVIDRLGETPPPAPQDIVELPDINLGGKAFPNTPLITHEGKRVRFFDDLIKDKVVAINFIFTSCQRSCPLETARMKHVQKLLQGRMGQDTFFYSISVDPETDTPEVLAAYHRRFGIGPGWTFLTGAREDIDQLQKKLGVYVDEVNRQDAVQDHSLNIIIGNQKTGQWLKRSGMDNPQIMAHNIARLHPQEPRAIASQGYEAAPLRIGNYSPGHKLYMTRCIDCHSIGGGDGIGPDLQGVTKIRDRKWLIRWIKTPDKMLSEQDPLATFLFQKYNRIPMPNLQLSDADVLALLEFLARQDTSARRPSAKEGQSTH